jgi:hypothetical protein
MIATSPNAASTRRLCLIGAGPILRSVTLVTGKVSKNVENILVGCGLIVLGFTYTGSYNGVFRRGQPDYPPTPQGRITFFARGLLFVVVGTIRMLKGY